MLSSVSWSEKCQAGHNGPARVPVGPLPGRWIERFAIFVLVSRRSLPGGPSGDRSGGLATMIRGEIA